MKRIKILLFALCLFPCVSHAAGNDFMVAAQLLSAAKNADIQQVQILINNGADVNFVDSTGLSIVCTALMNNDVRAAQILQMYGADASKCDRQIKQYNSRKKVPDTGGLFSGLSSAHGLTLAAAGAAVVVVGLLLLTDVFDGSGGGSGGSSNSNGGSHNPDGGGSGNGGTGTSTAAFTLPYGPAMPSAAKENDLYVSNLNYYSPDTDGSLKNNFALMTDSYKQNYLLMMHGYSPLARGYLGMRTLRNDENVPLDLSGNNLGSDPVMGGRPVNVALVTANGINATDTSSLANKFLIWTTTNNNNTTVNGASNSMISSKYYNNSIVLGADNESIEDDSVVEDSALVGNFDLSGFGTAINNIGATGTDNLVAKITGGNDISTTPDFIGFMPNGQMSIYRTGGGAGLIALGADDTAATGSYMITDGKLTTITLDSTVFNVSYDGNKITAVNGDITHTGYIGADGALYLDSVVDGKIDIAYSMDGGNLTQTKKWATIDYQNYKALYNAITLGNNTSVGRSMPSVIANSSVIEPLRGIGAATLDTVLSDSVATMQTNFTNLVHTYYNQNTTDGLAGTDYTPASDAVNFFGQLGLMNSQIVPLVVFSTGSYDTGNANWLGESKHATFENAAPLVFNNLEHVFMSVVAVGLPDKGTSGNDSVSGFAPSGKYMLSQWGTTNATEDTSDDKYYKSRICGIAGTGANGIDPWCFAAAGTTDENAVSAAAGAAGVLASAFDYLDSNEIFTLLALTADGAYLATNADGKAYSEESLISHLQSMYTLPSDYQYKYESGVMSYLDAFKEVFGYGLINLERATTPGTSVYYYDGDKIVSASGNAYWRAAQNTVFRPSSALTPRMATISAPFFDVLTSIDGEMSMPRVWTNEFSVGASSRRALYMGDTLSELHTRDSEPNTVSVGNMELSLTTSERAYSDSFGGLDNLNVRFASDNWELNAGYQHYQTDGTSRFSGMSNPIFALATNAINTSAKYKVGNWAFGMRAMSGFITDEGLLENDPTISAQYAPAHLGQMIGVQSDIAWSDDKFSLNMGFGAARESDTLLGAQTGGLLSMGAGDTMYIDTTLGYKLSDNVAFGLHGTVARTTSDAHGDFILGISDIWSDSVAASADIGNFNFSISRPLAATRGAMRYAAAEYDVVENADGKYELAINNTHVANVALRPENRELRLMGSYKHQFGEFTDGALGFIYRVNPNNTCEFGNEAIFMMKMTHRVGI